MDIKSADDIFNYIYKHCYERLLRYASSWKNLDVEPEDIISEAITKLYVKSQKGEVKFILKRKKVRVYVIAKKREYKLYGYLFGIVRHLCHRHYQGNKYSIEEINAILHDEFEDFGISSKAWSFYLNHFHQLSARCRLVIILKKKAGMSHGRIASLLEITEGSSRNLFSGCWSRFKKNTGITPREIEDTEYVTDLRMLYKKILDDFLADSSSRERWLEMELIVRYHQQRLERKIFEKVNQAERENIDFANEIRLLKELLSFFQELFAGHLYLFKEDEEDKEKMNYYKDRNKKLEVFLNRLEKQCQLLLMLYFALHEKTSTISSLLDLEDDQETNRKIYTCMAILLNHAMKEKSFSWKN